MIFLKSLENDGILIEIDISDIMHEFSMNVDNKAKVNILPYEAKIKSKHGTRVKFIIDGENDFEVAVQAKYKKKNPQTIPENLNHKQNKILKKYNSKIEKSSDLIYKYGMENLSNKEQKSIERNIRNIWQ